MEANQCTSSWENIRRAGLQDGEIVARVGETGCCVRALRPNLHPAIADAMDAAHRVALRRHGVEGLLAMNAPLREKHATWLLVAQRAGDGALCGGIRVDLRDAGQSLAVERAMTHFGAEQLALLRDRFIGSVGELAGLWVEDAFRKLGLACTLLFAGGAVARRAGLARLFALAPLHTRATFEALGYDVIHEMGDAGDFPYPDERYRSRMLKLDLLPIDEHYCCEYNAVPTNEETL